MKDSKLGYRETLTLLIIMISCKIFLSYPRNMAVMGDSAAWLIILLSGGGSLAGFFFIRQLLGKYPDDNIFNISRKIGGKFLGSALNLLIFLYFLTISTMLIREFAESFILSILPRTPISVITICFLILLIYSVLLGIETLSRLAWFFGPYLLIGLIVILAFSKPTDIQLLLPLLGSGPLPVLKNSIINLSGFSEIMLLAVVAPLVRDRKKIGEIGILSLTISTLILSGLTAIVLLTFNYVGMTDLVFPVFQLTRLISIGKFIQRVESIFVFLWFLTAVIGMSGLFYGTVVSFSEAFEIRDHRPLIFPVAVLVFTLSMIPQSLPDTVFWNFYIISRFYLVSWIGIPTFLWILSLFVKKQPEASNE
jgi:spore germination protein KB